MRFAAAAAPAPLALGPRAKIGLLSTAALAHLCIEVDRAVSLATPAAPALLALGRRAKVGLLSTAAWGGPIMPALLFGIITQSEHKA